MCTLVLCIPFRVSVADGSGVWVTASSRATALDFQRAFAEVCDWRQQTSGGLQASGHSERLTGPVKVTARDVWLTGEGKRRQEEGGFVLPYSPLTGQHGTHILYIQSHYPEFPLALARGQGCVAFTLWRLAVLLQLGLQIKNNIRLVLMQVCTQEESVPFLLGIGRQTSDWCSCSKRQEMWESDSES